MTNDGSLAVSRELQKAAIKPEWPGGYGIQVPDELINARIVAIGSFVDETLVPEGGLVINYVPVEGGTMCRIVIAFNDSGMWVVSPDPSSPSMRL